MLEFRRFKKLALFIQILKDHWIRFLYKHAGVVCLGGHIALSVHELYERQAVFLSHAVVVLTERRGDVYDSGTVAHGNIAVAEHEEAFLFLLRRSLARAFEQRLVFLIFQICTLIGFQNFVRLFSFFLCQLAQHFVKKGFRHIVGVFVRSFYLAVCLVRIDAETYVGRKGPGRCGPCQEVGILVLHLEADDGGTLFYRLVSLGNLLRGKRGSAAGTVGNDLKSFIEKTFIPDLL